MSCLLFYYIVLVFHCSHGPCHNVLFAKATLRHWWRHVLKRGECDIKIYLCTGSV